LGFGVLGLRWGWGYGLGFNVGKKNENSIEAKTS
jgi:hypothetical protein